MLVVPAATPLPIVERLNREFNNAMSSPEVRKRLAALSVEPGGGTLAEAAEFLRQQTIEWEKLIRTRSIKAN